jgi:hypothetical protein
LGPILHRMAGAPRNKLEPPDYSLDREPWRALGSSLAVKFMSRRRSGWSADGISAQAKTEIISGLEARSAIIGGYSRIQSAVRDLVAKAGFSVARGERRGPYSAAMKEVLSCAKGLTNEGGPLSGDRQMWNDLLDRVQATVNAVDLIVHGFVEVREETSRSIVFRIDWWGRRQSFTSDDLKDTALTLELLAGEAESRLATALPLL